MIHKTNGFGNNGGHIRETTDKLMYGKVQAVNVQAGQQKCFVRLPPIIPRPAFLKGKSKCSGQVQIWDDLSIKVQNAPSDLHEAVPDVDTRASVLPTLIGGAQGGVAFVPLGVGSQDPHLRVAQLEQNIRFLQEQHQQMLSGLHREIEGLRQKNRDLQFQLVFTKGGTAMVLSTPSSPELDTQQSAKLSLTPRVAEQSLQVELLERELMEVRVELQNADTKNNYLTAFVEEQKKKLEMQEAQFENREPDPDLLYKLQEAEKIMRCLRKENDEHRRELGAIRASLGHQNHMRGVSSLSGTPRPIQNGRGGGARNQPHPHISYQQSQARFPPLNTQSYWHQRGGHSRGNRSNRSEKVLDYNTSLPNLKPPAGYPYAASLTGYAGNSYKRGGGNMYYNGNGNHYYNRNRNGDRERNDTRPLVEQNGGRPDVPRKELSETERQVQRKLRNFTRNPKP